MVSKENLLRRLCGKFGLNTDIVKPSEFEFWKGVKIRISNNPKGVQDKFSFTSLNYDTAEDAALAVLEYLFINKDSVISSGKYIEGLPYASSITELELKLEVDTYGTAEDDK